MRMELSILWLVSEIYGRILLEIFKYIRTIQLVGKGTIVYYTAIFLT